MSSEIMPEDREAERMSLAGAIRSALKDTMRADPDVLVFGEDVGVLGGVFRVTDGLQREFGEARCFDTPISEAGILGMAIGLAAGGMRPVVEMQFDSFAYPAFEQMVSHLAKVRNRSQGTLCAPVVVRIPFGGGIGAVEHHSDSSEAYAAHTPGLQVLTPSTPDDAYHLLREALRGADPVIFFEPKRLYWEEGEVGPTGGDRIGRASICKAGDDVTLISYGPSVAACLRAAELAAAQGYRVGVVDLRSIVPLDVETLEEVVSSTGRAVVVHEAAGFGGFGAEICAQITERCFPYLEAPILRVTGLDVPYPPPRFEHLSLPNEQRILHAIAKTLSAE